MCSHPELSSVPDIKRAEWAALSHLSSLPLLGQLNSGLNLQECGQDLPELTCTLLSTSSPERLDRTACSSGSVASFTAFWIRSSICLLSGSVVSLNLTENGYNHKNTSNTSGMSFQSCQTKDSYALISGLISSQDNAVSIPDCYCSC